MASRFPGLRGWAKGVFGKAAADRGTAVARPLNADLVRLEDRAVPATFTVTNILDNQVDVVGGYSLRQAILAANATPGFDTINFNIPVSPSLPKLPSDGVTNYFPIVLASTLPDLTDPQGVQILADTQPRPDVLSTTGTVDLDKTNSPRVQLIPDPNPGAFPGSKGAFYITGNNNVIRGFAITGFPGSGVTIAGGQNNTVLGNYINTDIEGTRFWYQDNILAKSRRTGLANEITNNEKGTVLAGVTLLATGSGTKGAQNNTIGGLFDQGGAALVNANGDVIGAGGTFARTDGTVITITEATNRNVISGTPEYRRDIFANRERDITGAGAGPGIRLMDAFTQGNLIQGNFIGTDKTGTQNLGNHNGIELLNGAVSNQIGNPSVSGTGTGGANLIRFNAHDGVRVAQIPNFARPDQSGPGVTPLDPFAGLVAQKFIPLWHDAYSQNYYDGVSPELTAAGGRPQVIQVGVPNPNAADPPVVPGIAGPVGTKVTINGRNLLGLTGVAFRGPNNTLVPAVFTVVDDSTAIATVPAGSVTGPIRLFSAGGTTDSPDPFFVLNSPSPIIDLSSVVSPGAARVGDTVTIQGTNYEGTLSVTFGQTPASTFTVSADGKTITAVVPFGATTGQITVTTPGGGASTINQFTVQSSIPPNVTGFSVPQAVPGEEITITGSGFTGARSIIFNFSAASGGFSTSTLTIDSDTQIRVRIPLTATASNGPIQVLGSGGNAVSAASFRIVAPVAPQIDGFAAQPPGAVTATSGPEGTTILISGSGFTSVTGVAIGTAPVTRYTVLSDTQISAVVPASGSGLVTVTASGAQAISSAAFTLTPSGPTTITAVSAGRRNTFITIDGTGLLGTRQVFFGATNTLTGFLVQFPDIRVLSDTQIQVRVPLGASTGQVFAITPAAPAGAAGNFNLVASGIPTIDTLKLPDPRAAVPGATITIAGQGLLGVQAVAFTQQGGGTVNARFTVVNDNTLSVVVPATAATGPITVTNPAGTDTTADFTILTPPTPVITTFAPTAVQVGTPVIITGQNFTSATQVTFGGVPVVPGSFDVAGQFELLSDTQIRLRVPNGAANDPASGRASLSVVVAGGGSATVAAAFTVSPSPAPTIDFITPGGPRDTPIVIQGTGLIGTVVVLFNGVPSTKVTVSSDRRIVATVPTSATTGVITVITPGGTALSSQVFTITTSVAPIFNSQIPSDAAIPSNGKPDATIQPSGVRGSRIFINGTGLGTIYRVEFTGIVNGVVTPVPAVFQRIDVDGTEELSAIVPDNAVSGPIMVYASSQNAASAQNSSNGRSDLSAYTATNILDQDFVYGETFEVLPNPRPVVTGAAFENGANVRGSFVTIRGSGFLGATTVNIAGVAHGVGRLFFRTDGPDYNAPPQGGFDGLPDLSKINYGQFVIQDDSTIIVKLAVTGGNLNGTGAVPTAAVNVTGPGGTDLATTTVNIAATTPLTFGVVGFTPTGSSPVNGFPQYSGNPITAVWGDVVQLTAKTGTFFGATSVQFAGQNAPVTLISTDGLTITTVIPGGIVIPDPPPPPPMVPPFLPQRPLDPVVLLSGGGAQTSVNGGASIQLVRTNAPTVTFISVVDGPVGSINRNIRINGSNLQGISGVLFNSITVGGQPTTRFVPRSELGINGVDAFSVTVTIPVGTGKTNGLYDRVLADYVTGGVNLTTLAGTATGTFTTIAQPDPRLITFLPKDVATIDNRIVQNTIYANGDTDTAVARTNGDAAIDFVTDFTRFRDPQVLWSFDFLTGFFLPQRQGNEGRGGIDDGPEPFQQYPSFNPFSTFQNDARSNPNDPTGGNIYDEDTGPNNMQNFPLLQVVQSSVERTEFSTALIARAFRPYRIDYYYNDTTTNFGNAQDTTLANTSVSPQSQIWLGSKVITTDFQGNGSVSFTIYKPVPNPDGTFPAPGINEFRLPNNRPLPPNAVITAAATDLAAPGAAGASTVAGPDGTSRLSFFKPVDNTTGGITGTVFNDKNQNGVLDTGEIGVAGYEIRLFVDRGDGTRSPNSVLTTQGKDFFTTGADGVFNLTAGGGVTGGFGLPNGTHRITVTPPADGSLVSPLSGERFVTIQNGRVVTGQDFLVFSPEPDPNVPPTVPGVPPTVPGVPPTVPGVPPTVPAAPLPRALATGTDAGGTGLVRVYNNTGGFRYQFEPYPGFSGGVRVATADVNGDGDQDIITAPGVGMAGLVKVYNGRTAELLGQFLPYEEDFVGGVYVAAGDVDGDGKADIVTGVGQGGGPRVQIFSLADGTFNTIGNFFPYEGTFRGGVLVAVGDINRDGRADIVTGTGVGGGPRVQVFDGKTQTALFNFFAYEESFRGGVFASVGDVDGDGSADILTGTGVDGGPVVKVFKQTAFTTGGPINPVLSFFAYDPLFRGGVRVDAVDGNGDGRLDIVTAPGKGNPPDVRVVDFYTAQDIYRVQAEDPDFLGGVFVGGTH